MDYVLISDLTRYYVVVVALWLIAMLLRIFWMRWRRAGFGRQEMPHPFSVLGLVILLGVACSRRFEHLGQPGDTYLWVVFTGVTLVLAGVLINVKFTLQPPWRRH